MNKLLGKFAYNNKTPGQIGAWHLKNRNLNPSFTLVGRNEAANALTAKNRSGCSELTRIMSQLKSPAETQTVSDLHRII